MDNIFGSCYIFNNQAELQKKKGEMQSFYV